MTKLTPENLANLAKAPKHGGTPSVKPPAHFVFGAPRASKPEPAQKALRHGFDVPKKLGDYFT